jgi:predicted dehydrogenase
MVMKGAIMKWGIIGTGTIASKFACTVNDMKKEGEQLVAVASRNQKKADVFAAEYHIGHAFSSYEAMLASDEIDAVYIATPNVMHYEHAKMCLMAGKHVLCEKPFTTRVSQAEALYELAAAKKLFIMEAFWIRFLPIMVELKKIIENDVIGQVQYARSEYGFITSGQRKINKFAPELGGGALLDIGVYNLGFMNLVMGGNPSGFTSNVHMGESGTDDFSVINLHYEHADAVVTTSIGMVLERSAVIAGTKGTIYIPDFQHAEKMIVRPYETSEYIVEIPFDVNGFEYEIREVTQCIKEGKLSSEIYTPQMSLQTLQLMDDIRDSWDLKYPFEV